MQYNKLRQKRLLQEKEICGIKILGVQSPSCLETGYLQKDEVTAFVVSIQLCTTTLKNL